MKPSAILFVCTANICRSPMAEYLLKNLAQKEPSMNKNSLRVSSAGTMGTPGIDASDQALQVMRDRKIDMSRHKSRLANIEIVSAADLILCMENTHVSYLSGLFPAAVHKVHLLTEYCGAPGEVLDPSGQPTRVYEECAQQLEDLTRELLSALR